jgi:hypothetical protein
MKNIEGQTGDKSKSFDSRKGDFEGAFDANIEQFYEIQLKFKNSVKIESLWDSSWSSYIRFVTKNIADMTGIIGLCKTKNYSLAFSSLRTIFENLLLFRLYVSGKKIYYPQILRITPVTNQNPTARNNTLKRWKDELQIWKNTKDPKFKNYEEIRSIERHMGDSIIIERFMDGMYEKQDTEKKGRWMSPYFWLFYDYDPTAHFVSILPSVLESDFFPDLAINTAAGQKWLYKHFFTFNSFLENWRLNNFISEEQKDRIIVHYNFLSLFVHPNKEQDTKLMLAMQLGRETFEYKFDKHAELLILMYIVKLQELYLDILIRRLEEISRATWASETLSAIKQNASVADDLWFIYDKPTQFDIDISNSIRLQKKETCKGKPVIYYQDPLKRLMNMY